MPATTLASMTVGQALMASVATSAATALIGSVMAPKPQTAAMPAAEEKAELAPLPDREAIGRKAELDAARRSAASGRKSTVFAEDDLLGQ